MPVHSGHSPRVVLVAQEVDGLAVLPGNGTQTYLAPEFVLATFGQPLAEFFRVVFCSLAWQCPLQGPPVHYSAGGRARWNCKNGLINQVQEAPEGDEAVAFLDFPESRGVRDKVLASPLPRLDHAFLHLKPLG